MIPAAASLIWPNETCAGGDRPADAAEADGLQAALAEPQQEIPTAAAQRSLPVQGARPPSAGGRLPTASSGMNGLPVQGTIQQFLSQLVCIAS